MVMDKEPSNRSPEVRGKGIMVNKGHALNRV